MWLFAWRDISIYFEYQRGNSKTVTSECISVSVDRTNEPRLHSVFTIYSLHLKNGISVAIYKETVDEQIQMKHVPQQKKVLEQQFVTGRPITVTFVAKPNLVNNTYALMSASDGGKALIDATAHYSTRVKTMVIMDSILYGMAILSLALPVIPYLHKELKRRQNRRRKKQHKQKHLTK